VWFLLAVSLTSLPQDYMKIVRAESKKFGFDPLLVAAVVYKESRFNNRACFRGSHGLMQIQLRPRSCKKSMSAAVAQGLYDPRTNVRRGLRLMFWWRRWWRKHHSRDGYHWLLHYNQGFGRCPKDKSRCKRSERIPVRTGKVGGYADRVLELYHKLKKSRPTS
jgi:hypothetical protein